jgi:hypothetical protein
MPTALISQRRWTEKHRKSQQTNCLAEFVQSDLRVIANQTCASYSEERAREEAQLCRADRMCFGR